jgi:sporulation protein YlmC with PRC-barrel domain
MILTLAMASAGAATSHDEIPAGFIKGSNLIGKHVKNSAGETLGKVKDVVIDLNQRTIAYAVLSSGGILDFGDKLFAVPIEALHVDADGDHVVLDVPKESFNESLTFDDKNWPTEANSSLIAGAVSSGTTTSTESETSASTESGTQTTTTESETGASTESGTQATTTESETGISTESGTQATTTESETGVSTESGTQATTTEGETGATSSTTAVNFEQLDTDGDSKISMSEATGNDALNRQFTDIDKNGDGQLDKVEFAAFEATGETGQSSSTTEEQSESSGSADTGSTTQTTGTTESQQ